MDFFVIELRTLIDDQPVFFGGAITRKLRTWMFYKARAILPEIVEKMVVRVELQEDSAIRWIKSNGYNVDSDRKFWYAIIKTEGSQTSSQQAPSLPKLVGYFNRHAVKMFEEPFTGSKWK
jgi:hypothetical protein